MKQYMKNKNIKRIKFVIFIAVVIISVCLIIYLFPLMKNLSTLEGQVAFKEKVNNSGIYGYLMLLGLQFAQIFLVVLPGEPLEVLSGMCYGVIRRNIFYIKFSRYYLNNNLFSCKKIWKRIYI